MRTAVLHKQKLEVDAPILFVTNPSGDMLKIIPPEQFTQHENDVLETDYCTIMDGNVYFSSKAKYNYVVVKHIPKDLINNNLNLINELQ